MASLLGNLTHCHFVRSASDASNEVRAEFTLSQAACKSVRRTRRSPRLKSKVTLCYILIATALPDTYQDTALRYRSPQLTPSLHHIHSTPLATAATSSVVLGAGASTAW